MAIKTGEARRRGHWLWIAGPSVFLGAVLLWLSSEPGSFIHLPGCPILALTGWYCAGCGITRALTFVLHGHLWAAVRMNALAMLLLPAMAVWLGRLLWLRSRGRTMAAPPLWVVWAIVGAIVFFTVARNLPWPPFVWLAPTLIG